MAKEKILVVDDEKDVLDLVCYNLLRSGFQVIGAATGQEALNAVKNHMPDLVVLDLMLPDIDGLEVARQMKTNPEYKDIPIVMLTARTEEIDIMKGFELGADDYVTKPFSPRILEARVNAVLQRKNGSDSVEESGIRIYDLYVHPGHHKVSINGKQIKLTLKEFKILLHLISKPGWVFTRSEIVDAVSGKDYAVTDRSVDVHILGLRRKLGHAGAYIETLRGVGYRFKG